jgi:hypothetical protein
VKDENTSLGPPSVVTIMPTAPALRADVIQVIVLLFTIVKDVAAIPSNVTEVAPVKFVPVIVRLVPPAVLPVDGEILLITGGIIITPNATPNPEVEKMEVPVRPVQLTPSVLVAILFVPPPTATQSPLLQVTLRPKPDKAVLPRLVQLTPSILVAMVVVPSPTATQSPFP